MMNITEEWGAGLENGRWGWFCLGLSSHGHVRQQHPEAMALHATLHPLPLKCTVPYFVHLHLHAPALHPIGWYHTTHLLDDPPTPQCTSPVDAPPPHRTSSPVHPPRCTVPNLSTRACKPLPLQCGL